MDSLEVRGAPHDQGWAQGRAWRAAVRSAVLREREGYGLAGWIAALYRVRRGPGREFERFLPQQHERLEGLARGAGVSNAALELVGLTRRVRGNAAAEGGSLLVRFEAPPDLLLRRSQPDAGGFASAELTAPAWAGCLGGVNSQGVCVACASDPALEVPSLRLLAQDALFRAARRDAAVEHVRRRGGYLRATGTLLVVDPASEPLLLELRDGDVRARPAPAPGDEVATLILDAPSRTLLWQDQKLSPSAPLRAPLRN